MNLTVYFALGSAARVFFLVAFFTPILGLFDCLKHWTLAHKGVHRVRKTLERVHLVFGFLFLGDFYNTARTPYLDRAMDTLRTLVCPPVHFDWEELYYR